MGRIALRGVDRGRTATDRAEIERARQLVRAAVEAMAEIRGTDVGLFTQAAGELVDVAVHGRRHDAEAALPVAQILRQAEHAVIGEGLERGATDVGFPGYSLYCADCETAGQSTRDLRRTENPAGVVPDPARIEQAFRPAVHGAAVDREIEDAGSLHEEWAALLIEGLERREVDDRWVGIDLPEIGVDGRVDRDVGGDSVFDVGAAVDLLIVLEPRLGDVLRNGVRRQLQSPRRWQAVQAHQVAELRNKAAPGRPEHRPADALTTVSIDVAPNPKAKDVAGLVRIAELRQRKPELRCPAERVDLGRDLPHAVPGVVFLLIVPVHRVVTLHPARVHRELEAGAAVVVGVDHDLDLVTADAGVAAGE